MRGKKQTADNSESTRIKQAGLAWLIGLLFIGNKLRLRVPGLSMAMIRDWKPHAHKSTSVFRGLWFAHGGTQINLEQRTET